MLCWSISIVVDGLDPGADILLYSGQLSKRKRVLCWSISIIVDGLDPGADILLYGGGHLLASQQPHNVQQVSEGGLNTGPSISL